MEIMGLPHFMYHEPMFQISAQSKVIGPPSSVLNLGINGGEGK